MKIIVIDMDTLSRVFNEDNSEHDEYEPLCKSILSKRKKIAYGGEKYNDELEKAGTYLRLFNEFKKTGTAIQLDDDEVNENEKDIKRKTKNTNFNDQHIIAIVIVKNQCFVS